MTGFVKRPKTFLVRLSEFINWIMLVLERLQSADLQRTKGFYVEIYQFKIDVKDEGIGHIYEYLFC